MKTKYIILSTVFAVFINFTAIAQANLLNARTVAESKIIQQKTLQAQGEDKPVSYGYVEDRDILWGKSTWEVIDLNERVNFPLYFPIDKGTVDSNRKSLYQVLVENIENGTITEVYADSYFNDKRDLKDIQASLVYKDTTDFGYAQLNAGESLDAEYVRSFNIDAADIIEYRIRGYWYIDKRLGELKFRLIGLCPVAVEARSKAFPDEMENKVELFWVFYPDAREALHKVQAFNAGNSANTMSFDHLLNSRRFSAVIYKDENEYGDREISSYIRDNALFQLLESERIKEKIRDIEMDLWAN